MSHPIEQRAARRLLRRSRSVWVSIALAVVALAATLVIVELLLSAFGLPPLLMPLDRLVSQATGGGVIGAAVAAAAAVLGASCLWGALSPGRTGRRVIHTERMPVVVDDAIIAGSVSRGATLRASVSPAQVNTRIARRRADVAITPSTGFAVPAAEVQRTEGDALAALALTPPVAVRVRVDERGVLA
jgi:hypothetical protein